MSENTEQKTGAAGPEKIDLTIILEQFMHGIRRVGWLVVLLTVIFAALSYFQTTTSYVPVYRAEATLTISSTKSGQAVNSGNYMDVTTAQQLGKIFPYILTSGVLSDLVAQDLGTTTVPGSISVTAVENTNLITISVTAADGQTAYDVLQSVIKNYPEVAQFVIGQTEVQILDETGVPSDSGVKHTSRGSIRSGAVKGFGLGMMILVLYVACRRTIRYPGDFKSLLNIPCLGTIPVYKMKKRRKNVNKSINITDSNVAQEYLEALRAVRTRVERRMEKENKKTLMVTSSVPGEGKSTIAVNLALSFAQKGKRVILVDCDLRNPSVQKQLNIEGNFPGIGAVLRKDAKLSESLYTMPDKDIDMKVFCGAPNSTRRVEILGSDTMKAVLEQLEGMADLVILDTSPSAMLVDALVMARHVPMALYVVKYDFAKVRHILEGIEELADTGINIIGCVLNAGKEGSVQSGYGYRYGRYGHYSRYSRSKYDREEK